MAAHRTWIKICGITRLADAQAAVEAGADAVGFVLTESPRRIAPEDARRIGRVLPTHVLRVGVFVDELPTEVMRAVTAADVDRVQVHGLPDPLLGELYGARLLRAFRVRDEGVLDAVRDSTADTFLLDAWSPDAPGGTGRTFDWDLAVRARAHGRLILAGGLNPGNVAEAVRRVRPWGVDVSTGVEEAPGRKDPGRIRAFVAAVRDADAVPTATAAGDA